MSKFLAATAFSICIATLAPSLCNAQAALIPPQNRMVLPPLEYDHPYDGDVWILRADAEQMQRLCPPPKIAGNLILGCTRLKADGCYIVIGHDDILRKAGFTYRLVLPHEVGHCDSWPNDHRGARLATEKDW